MARTTSKKKSIQTAPAVRPPSTPVPVEQHGLNLPQWNVNSVLPTDLYSDSSSLPATSKSDADAAIETIEKKRNTVRIVRANLDLSSDLIGAATAYRKMEGLAIDYATEGIHNSTRLVRQQTAQVKLETEQVKLQGEQHRQEQAQIRTDGIGSLTLLTRDEWEQRRLLAQSKVDSLRLAVEQADNQYQESLRNLLSAETN